MDTIFDFSRFPILTTPRLRLRPLQPEDAEATMALFGDPRILRFLNQPPTDTPAKALALINWLNGHYERHEAVQWAITLHGDDRMIGTCGAYAWDRDNRRVDIGYHVLVEYWGQGYATEATRALLGWCFANLDVHRIQADCTDGNIASERVLLKCGFRLEGIWRESCWEHGRFVDIKQFGLLRREAERWGEMRTASTEQIYQRGDHYDRLLPGEMQPFWAEVAAAYGGPILELGSGTGRIAIPLAQAGYAVTGLDVSPAMQGEARRKADAAGVQVDWQAGDMRAFDLGKQYRLILLPANALCHLLTRADFEACMACVRRHLHPEGRFVIQVFVPDLNKLLEPPDERRLFSEYDDPDGGGRIVVTESATYDPATQIRHNRTYYRFSGQAEEEVGELPMRMYFPQELDALLNYNGFTIEHKYGGLDRRLFASDSPMQVYLLTLQTVGGRRAAL